MNWKRTEGYRYPEWFIYQNYDSNFNISLITPLKSNLCLYSWRIPWIKWILLINLWADVFLLTFLWGQGWQNQPLYPAQIEVLQHPRIKSPLSALEWCLPSSSALNRSSCTVLSPTEIIKMVFELSVGHLAILDFLTRTCCEDQFLKLTTNTGKMNLLFLNQKVLTACLGGRRESRDCWLTLQYFCPKQTSYKIYLGV